MPHFLFLDFKILFVVKKRNNSINCSGTVGSLQERVEALSTENALIKEDQALTKQTIEKTQVDN